MYDVVKNHNRPSEDLLKRFHGQQPATLHESMGKKGAMLHDIRPTTFDAYVCGSALTVHCRPGDNLMLHKAVSIAQPGDVLVVCVDGFQEGGIWGEIITEAARMKGIVGIVTDGTVRDSVPIRDLGFPMFSRGLSMRGTTKMTGGTINNPIIMQNVLINPGDIVVGDNDGVVVVPLEHAEEVLAAAIAKEAAERKIIERVKAGECTMDILGIQEAYERLGLKEEK